MPSNYYVQLPSKIIHESKQKVYLFVLLQDRVITENKELHLKLGLILDENARLKSIIYSMQQQQQNGERMSNEEDEDNRLWSTNIEERASSKLTRSVVLKKEKISFFF